MVSSTQKPSFSEHLWALMISRLKNSVSGRYDDQRQNSQLLIDRGGYHISRVAEIIDRIGYIAKKFK